MKGLRNLYEFLGLDMKKELLKLALLDIAVISGALLIYILLKKALVCVIFIVGIMAFDYMYFSALNSKRKKMLNNRNDEFVAVISYFQIFIGNHFNVYSAFEKIIPYCSSWMGGKIENMLREIDADKSVQPFMNFASQFTSSIVGNVMMSIYQMVDEGESNLHLTQFTILFEQLSKTKQVELINKRKDGLDNISIFPLIGAGAITILLTFGIISILGDLINVI